MAEGEGVGQGWGAGNENSNRTEVWGGSKGGKRGRGREKVFGVGDPQIPGHWGGGENTTPQRAQRPKGMGHLPNNIKP